MTIGVVNPNVIVAKVGRTAAGTAGGDLSGTFPNPSVAKVAGVTPGATGLVVLATATAATARTALGVGTTDAPTFAGLTLTGSAVVTLGVTASVTPISVTGSVNNYFEQNNQNTSNGTAASSDFVATADTGNATTLFVDMGKNGSGWTGTTWGAALDGYLYDDGGNLWIGTNTTGKVVRINAGGGAAANTVMTIAAAGVTVKGTTTLDTALTGVLKATAGVVAGSAAFADLTAKPTTLAGYGITDAQPLDSDLTAIAALATTTFGRSLLTQADAAAARTTLGVAAGTKSIALTFTGSLPAGTYLSFAPAVAALPTTQGGPTTYPETAGVFLGAGSYVWPSLTTISFTDTVGVSGGTLSVTAATCTSFSLPVCTVFASTTVFTLAAATTFSIPNLAITGSFTLNAASLTSFSAPALTTVDSLNLTLNACTSLTLSTITNCTSGITISSTGMTTFSLSNLAAIGGSLGVTANSLTSWTLSTLTTVGSSFTVTANALATFSANSITTVGGSWSACGNGSGNTVLTSFSATGLTTVGGNLLIPVTTAALATISFPALTTIGGSLADNAGAITRATSTLSFAALTTITQAASGGTGMSFFNATWSSLTTVTFTNLASVGNVAATSSNGIISISNWTVLTTLSFPALATLDTGTASGTTTAFSLTNMPALTTLSLAALVTINSLGTNSINLISGTAALATLTFGGVGVTKKISGNIVISSCALNQASVDGILARLVALDGTGGTTLYTGAKTVTITGTSSTPSAGGITNKNTLIARGITVTTN